MLYALFDRDDEHHERARQDVARLEPIVVPREILVETINLIEYRVDRSVARDALQDLLQTPNLSMAEPVHVEAAQGIFAESAGVLSLADAFVVQTCLSLGATPLSYDDEINRLAARRTG